MTVTQGHLTAAEKKVVKYFLDNNITEGRVRNKDYYVSEDSWVYTVVKRVMDRGLIPCPGSKLRLSTYIYKFTL